jgi:hypothetical protein
MASRAGRLRHLEDRRTAGSLDGPEERALSVKASGGDLGSIRWSGFARPHERSPAFRERSRGPEHEGELVALYPLRAYATSSTPPSIDAPPHRVTGEFHLDAVREGATALGTGRESCEVPRAGAAARASAVEVHSNPGSLSPSEAFRIEHRPLEEAKLRRQAPERELSRQIVAVVRGTGGIGSTTAPLAARRGAHVSVADRGADGARRTPSGRQRWAARRRW